VVAADLHAGPEHLAIDLSLYTLYSLGASGVDFNTRADNPEDEWDLCWTKNLPHLLSVCLIVNPPSCRHRESDDLQESDEHGR
jgi:hypothetical protein